MRRVDSKTALVAVGNGAAAEGVILFTYPKLTCQILTQNWTCKMFIKFFNANSFLIGRGLLAEGGRHDCGKIQCVDPL